MNELQNVEAPQFAARESGDDAAVCTHHKHKILSWFVLYIKGCIESLRSLQKRLIFYSPYVAEYEVYEHLIFDFRQ